MNVLMINYEFPPIGGGAANAHKAILEQFTFTENLKVDVLTCTDAVFFQIQKFSPNIKIYKVPIHKKSSHNWRKSEVVEWLIKAGVFYRKLLRKNRYDLVHAFFAFPSAFLCTFTSGKLPYIISLRGSDVPGHNSRLTLDYKLLSPLFGFIWNRASMVVANSKSLADEANQFIPDLRIPVIPNGVDLARFVPCGRKDGGKVRLLTVSRLSETKRIDRLIKATAILRKLGLDVELNVAGRGPVKDQLICLAKDLKIGGYVNFLGLVDAESIPKVYQENDIFVMASAREGMSNAMLEAMASGLPVVSTPCGGTEELIDGNGTITKGHDPASIAEAIKKIAQNQSLYEQMSKISRERAGKFSWRNTADQYLKKYEQILMKCQKQ